MEHLLEMKGICKSFFGKAANDHVDLIVERGEIHALLGENGAGKTTLMNILYGIYTYDEGSILLKGEEVRFISPKDAIDRKIGMVHQHFMLVPNLTVSENITLGLKEKGYPFTDRAALDRKIRGISEQFGLPVDPGAKVSTLSVGQQQCVEIMKLLYRDVELLILDEPTAVLTPQETEDFFRILKRLKEDGRAIVIITHRIPEVMEISDRVTVLRDGQSIVTESTKDLTDEMLAQQMIGRPLKTMVREECVRADQEGLVIQHLSMESAHKKQLDDFSLTVRAGEIVGIAGVDGNGQKDLVEAIVGIRPYQGGTISLAGKNLDSMKIEERKNIGIGYISDDRHRDGLIMDMDLTENLLLRSKRDRFLTKGFIRRKELDAETTKLVEQFAIKTHSNHVPIRLLSGGNQQKLILARELYDGVRLIIAFQPTRGLDIGASEFIRELLLQYKKEGCSVLLLSADLEEIFSISDRIAVIHHGTIMGEIPNDGEVDLTKIGLLMAGKESKEAEGGWSA